MKYYRDEVPEDRKNGVYRAGPLRTSEHSRLGDCERGPHGSAVERAPALSSDTDAGSYIRNDRIIGLALKSQRHEGIESVRDLPKPLLDEIEHFFAAYNEIKGKGFKPLGRYGPKRRASW